MTRRVYGLVATGRRGWCDGTHTILSKKAFLTREEAEAYKPEFAQIVTEQREDRPLSELDREGLRIHVAELELVEPGAARDASN